MCRSPPPPPPPLSDFFRPGAASRHLDARPSLFTNPGSATDFCLPVDVWVRWLKSKFGQKFERTFWAISDWFFLYFFLGGGMGLSEHLPSAYLNDLMPPTRFWIFWVSFSSTNRSRNISARVTTCRPVPPLLKHYTPAFCSAPPPPFET